MVAGCIFLVAILCSILVPAAKAFPDFVRRTRIGLHLAEGLPRALRPDEQRGLRVIEFPLSPVSRQ